VPFEQLVIAASGYHRDQNCSVRHGQLQQLSLLPLALSATSVFSSYPTRTTRAHHHCHLTTIIIIITEIVISKTATYDHFFINHPLSRLVVFVIL
jgi:hypothetical protein